MRYFEFLPQVRTRSDFIRFLGLLAVDAQLRPDEWESATIPELIDTMAVWMSAMKHRYEDGEVVAWREVAEVFAAAVVYDAS